MSDTDLLAITLLQASQNDKTTTVNQALVDLEDVVARRRSFALAGVDLVLTDADTKAALFEFTGTPGADRNITIPDAREKLYLARDFTTDGFRHTFKTVSGAGVVLSPEWKLLYNDGTDVVELRPVDGAEPMLAGQVFNRRA